MPLPKSPSAINSITNKEYEFNIIVIGSADGEYHAEVQELGIEYTDISLRACLNNILHEIYKWGKANEFIFPKSKRVAHSGILKNLPQSQSIFLLQHRIHLNKQQIYNYEFRGFWLTLMLVVPLLLTIVVGFSGYDLVSNSVTSISQQTILFLSPITGYFIGLIARSMGKVVGMTDGLWLGLPTPGLLSLRDWAYYVTCSLSLIVLIGPRLSGDGTLGQYLMFTTNTGRGALMISVWVFFSIGFWRSNILR